MTESNRNSLMQAGDAIRRSLTRNSHYSHASTHSWVISNHQNPPPPPPLEDPGPFPSPFVTPRPLPGHFAPSPSARTPRPLPDPQSQAQYHHQLRTANAELTPATPEDEEEYMNIEPNYFAEGLDGRQPIDEFPTVADMSPGRERGFVGGFVSGLRRLPRVVLKYRSFGDKRKYFRRATYGSGGTLTENATETGNTLPVYVSNPSTPIASSSRYVERLEMPVPQRVEPPPPDILGPSLSQRRHHPSFRISPPTDEAVEQERTTELPVDTVERAPSASATPGRISNPVTMLNLPDHEYQTEEPLPTPTPNRLSNSHSQNARSPAASIPAEVETPSPVIARPSHTADYRKMTLSSSTHSRTMTTSLSSEPSFSSQLSPVKSFLVKLYRLPWVTERVTEDYVPGGRDGRYRIRNGVKKPMKSWYSGKPGLVFSAKDGSGELDLLSSNSGSRRTSTGTSSTPLSSPALRVRHRSSDQRTRHREPRRRTRDGDNSSRNHGRSRHRRNTVISMTDVQPQNNSPMIPAVYSYPYPFPIPYPTFPPPPPPPQRAQSQSTPRGPRPYRAPTHPHGYVPFQSPQPPHPVFVMHSPAQSANSGDASLAQTNVMPSMYVPVSFIPGILPQESTQQAASPPAPSLPTSHPTGGVDPSGSA